MTNYIKVAGNPKIGIVTLRDDGAIQSLGSVEPPSSWLDATDANNIAPAAPGTQKPYVYFANTGPGGTTTVAGPNGIEYLTALGNRGAKWKSQPKPDRKVVGAAGDPVGGFMLLGDDQKIYQLSADGKEWKAASAAAPFGGSAVKLIAGDIKTGVLAVSSDPMSAIARSTADCCGWTVLKPASPVEIDMITGDFTKGFVVYGEGQLYSLTVAKDPVWAPLATPAFNFVAISGNPTDGLAAIIADSSGDGNIVVYNLTPGKGPWSLAQAPHPVVAAAVAQPAREDKKEKAAA